MATAGLIMGYIGVLVPIIGLIAAVAAFSGHG